MFFRLQIISKDKLRLKLFVTLASASTKDKKAGISSAANSENAASGVT